MKKAKEIEKWRQYKSYSPTRSYESRPARLETSGIQMNPTKTEDDCNIIDTPIFKNTMEYLSDQSIKLASGEKPAGRGSHRLSVKAGPINRKQRNYLSPPKPLPKMSEQITFTRIDSSFNKARKRSNE